MVTPIGKPWFSANRRRWGWGLPFTWQGWVVTALIFVAALTIALLVPRHSELWYELMVLLAGASWGIFWLKGEPPDTYIKRGA